MASPHDQGCRCAQCGAAIAESAEHPKSDALPAPDDQPSSRRTDAADPRPGEVDDRLLDEQLGHVGRIVRSKSSDAAAAQRRVDEPHEMPPAWLHHATRQAAEARPKRPQSAGSPQQHAKRRPVSLLAWTLLSGGFMAFAFGSVLLGWSLMSARPELWNLGLPFALVGQVVLLVGLVTQLDRLGSDNRHTVEQLASVDDRLEDLNRSTQLLGTMHNSASHRFYAHLSQGASSRVLLADLKSQLDLLAIRMSEPDDR